MKQLKIQIAPALDEGRMLLLDSITRTNAAEYTFRVKIYEPEHPSLVAVIKTALHNIEHGKFREAVSIIVSELERLVREILFLIKKNNPNLFAQAISFSIFSLPVLLLVGIGISSHFVDETLFDSYPIFRYLVIAGTVTYLVVSLWGEYYGIHLKQLEKDLAWLIETKIFSLFK